MSKVVHSGYPDELDFASYLSHTRSFFADGEYSLCIYMVCCAIGKSCIFYEVDQHALREGRRHTLTGLNRCI